MKTPRSTKNLFCSFAEKKASQKQCATFAETGAVSFAKKISENSQKLIIL